MTSSADTAPDALLHLVPDLKVSVRETFGVAQGGGRAEAGRMLGEPGPRFGPE